MNEDNESKKIIDPKEIIRKLKESGTITFGEFNDLVKLNDQGKLDREDKKIFQKELKKFTELTIHSIPKSLKNIFAIPQVNPILKLLANIDNTILSQQIKRTQELSNEILKDITPLQINTIHIPQPIIDKSIKLENQISKLKESVNKLTTNVEQIGKQTKPPTKNEKRIVLLKGITLGVGCSVIGGVILFFILQ